MAKASKQEEARDKSPTRPVAQKIHEAIAAKFGEAVELVDAIDPFTVVKDVVLFTEVMKFLRHDPSMQFDFLRSVTGVDWPEDGYIDSVYHLYSYPLEHAHVVKYRCPRAAPEVPSVEGLWPTANWFERETFDLLGIIYLNHSDLRRIMLPDDWTGHPLRKDYTEEQDYRGIGTTRASPLAAFKQMDETRAKAREERGEDAPAPIVSKIEPPADWVDPKEKRKAEAAAKAKAAAKAAEKPKAPDEGKPPPVAAAQKAPTVPGAREPVQGEGPLKDTTTAEQMSGPTVKDGEGDNE
ncbi:MAG: NADH-quinone oxidoreductase subunit C [Deltaproteobacteria bacterium]